MGYEVRGVVARTQLARAVAEVLGGHTRAVDLAQGYALVPYTEAAYDGFIGRHGAPLAPFEWLGATVAELLARASQDGPLAYVEADYFGGVGQQHAAVWEGGALAWGPRSVGIREAPPAQGTAISQALRRIGVDHPGGVDAKDEFEAVGMGRCREVEDWLPESPGSGDGE